MSELLNNAEKRKELLKHMIMQLHKGEAPETVKTQLARLLGKIPYNEVVEVEQELINEGLPEEEILRLCDIHTAALKGNIDSEPSKTPPPGHPIDTFHKENRALEWELDALRKDFQKIREMPDDADAKEIMLDIRTRFNALSDVEKHYQRKENLLFPYLEKHEITGPPKVMWGKHDETREYLKAAFETLENIEEINAGEAKSITDLALKPASDSIEEMIYKEENILFPMCLDTLSEQEWYNIYNESLEIGFCLYDPTDEWKPEGVEITEEAQEFQKGRVQLPSGNFTPEELNSILNTIPFDLTFVDSEDTVRYFTQGRERIFARNRAILGRKVQRCHPSKSVHIVEQILKDFRSGEKSHAAFWITMKERFVSIEYFALRNKDDEYLGCLEVSQDLTEKRKLEGQQRLLNYVE